MTTDGDDRDFVSSRAALQSAVLARLGADRCEVWLGAGAEWSRHGAVVRLTIENEQHLRFVRKRFQAALADAVREIFGDEARLEIVGAAKPANSPREHSPRDDERPAAGPTSPLAEAPQTLAPRRAARPVATHRPDEANRPDDPPPVLRFPAPSTSSTRRWATLDEFVAGGSNRLAQASIVAAVEQPGRHNPLFLHGPTGVGKTHLLEALLTSTRAARPRASVLYLTSEQFTAQYVAASRGADSRGTGLPSFRRKLRGVDLLLLDDLQFFEGKPQTLIELQYTLKTLLADGKQVAAAADRPLVELTALGPEIVQRLHGGLSLRVDPPDTEARAGIARQLASSRGVELPAEVVNYVAAHFTEHARAISGAVNRLAALARLEARPMTFTWAEQALADLLRTSRRQVGLVDIERAVCEAFGLERHALKTPDIRCRRMAPARALAMCLARQHTRAPLAEIGHFFGGRSHSTVVSAQRKVSNWIAERTSIAVGDRACEASEAIRRVEAILKIG